MFTQVLDMLNSSCEQTRKDIETFKTLREDLQVQNKLVSDLNGSLITIKTYYDNIDIETLSSLLQKDTEKLRSLQEQHSTMQKSLVEKKEHCAHILKSILSLYNDINKTLVSTVAPTDSNTLTVEVAKALYQKCSDNRQLRSDPPINGIHKIDENKHFAFGKVEPNNDVQVKQEPLSTILKKRNVCGTVESSMATKPEPLESLFNKAYSKCINYDLVDANDEYFGVYDKWGYVEVSTNDSTGQNGTGV